MNENQQINKLNKRILNSNISNDYFHDYSNENFLLEKGEILSIKNDMIQPDIVNFKITENLETDEVPEKILGVKKKILENKFTYNLGHWTKREHLKFLKGLCLFQKDYGKLSEFIKTRSLIQVRSHSQKFFKKYKEMLLKNEPSLTIKGKINSIFIKELIKISTLCKKNKSSTDLTIKEMIGSLKKKRMKKLSKSTLMKRSLMKYSNYVIVHFKSDD